MPIYDRTERAAEGTPRRPPRAWGATMTDAGFTISGEALSRPNPMADGSGAHLSEQVSIEADRLSGAVQDGVEAVETASESYSNLLTDTYTRMIRASMKRNSDIGNHLLALMRAKTPADVFRMNLEFMQNQITSTQDRILEVIGIKSVPKSKASQGGNQP